MAKAGSVVSGISSVVGVIAASNIAPAALIAGGVTTLTTTSAVALSIAIPMVGAVLGLMMADTFFGTGSESRSMGSYLVAAACSLIGSTIGSTLLGGVAFASSANLVTQEAVKQTLATGVATEPIKQMMAITTVGALAGSALGSISGVSFGDWLSKSK